jgi:FkbM family methyltransferase
VANVSPIALGSAVKDGVFGMTFKTVVRTLQVRFPALLEFRHVAQRTYLRAVRRPFDDDFRFLSTVRFAPDELLIDIGANRGQSIDAVRLYHPGQRIVAFEPNPNLATKLRRRFGNDSGLVIQNFGLGDKSGDFTLHVPCYNGWDFDGQAALTFGEHQLRYIRESIIGFDEAKLQYKRFRCEVQPLDRFDLKAGFIKIDTEGFELKVLHGAIGTIRKYFPILLIENTLPRDVIEFLEPMGYREFHFEETLCPGRGVRNTIYVHSCANRLRH